VLTGPTVKDLTYSRTSWTVNNPSLYYESVPKCAAFQLFAHLFNLGVKDYNSWTCKEIDFSILPDTFNTVNRLGLSGQDTPLTPEVSIAETRLLAPNSSLKDAFDQVSFYLDFDYFLRLSLRPNSSSGMKAIIKRGSVVVAKAGGQKAKEADISLGAELKQHQTYTLEIYHYPADSELCNTYVLNLEMRLRSSILKTTGCSFIPPGGDIVHEREAGMPTYMFEYSDIAGTSTQALDSVFSYPTSSKPFSAEVPFSVTADRAVVSGYLQSSFVESGLILEITDSEGVVARGRYENAHRFELSPIELETGDYTAVIREATNATSSGLCVTYSVYLLKEDADMWDDYNSLLRKTKTCRQIDQTYTLNTIGQLEEGQVHWKKQVPLNVYIGLNFYELNVKEKSIVRVQIEEYQDVKFTVALLDKENDYEGIYSQELSGSSDVLDGEVEPGEYFLEILFESEAQLPSVKQCPSILLTVQVLPISVYDALTTITTCKTSETLPGSMSGNFSGSFKQITTDAVAREISFEVAYESEISFKASYEELLSGAITLRLLDEDSQLIGRGFAVENYSELREVVPEGSYKVLIEAPTSSLPGVCYTLILDFSTAAVDSSLECVGAELPTKMWTQDSKPFGGPQAKDGQISFYGRFKSSGNPSDTVAFKVTENSVLRALFSSEGLQLGLSVFDSKYSDKALAYTRKNTDHGSFIMKLVPQDTPYLLVISYTSQGLKTGCPLFDLKLALEPIDSLQTRLECKAPEQPSYLPATSLEFWGSDLSEGTYYIFDKWVIKDGDLPPGTKSKGKPNEPFSYEIALHFGYPGVLSAYTLFDFLTNDVSILLRREGTVLSTSQWELWTQDAESDVLNFAQSFESVEVDEGDYTLTLKQSIASNHLVQMFDDVDICFPFSFALEYEPAEDVQFYNRLLVVEPEELPSFNPSNKLSIVLKFEQLLQLTAKQLTSVANLQAKSGENVAPTKVKVDSRHKQHLVVEFAEKALREGTCYELVLNLAAVSMDDEALPLADDRRTHTYCTAKCQCNPKAQGRCDDKLQCVCPFPYAGPLCYDCEEGFQPEKSRCVPVKVEDAGGLQFISDISPQGSPLIVKKQDEVSVQVTLTGKPHTAKGEFINKTRNVDAIISTFLLERVGQKIPERYKPLKVASMQDGLVWVFTYKMSDLQEAALYKLVIIPGLIFDAKGRPFRLNAETPSFMIEETEADLTDCSGRGTWSKTQCVCQDGYAGDSCEGCEEGWLMDDEGTCSFIKLDFADMQPKIISVSPSKAKFAVSAGELFKVEIKLSTKPYTDAKRPINSVVNTKHLRDTFYLHRTGKQTDITLKPKTVSASSDTLTWTLNFDSSELQEGVYYRLAFKPDVLFDSQGVPFVSEIAMPSFGIPGEKKTEAAPQSQVVCPNGILYKDECICDVGYTGPDCKDCDAGFIRDVSSRCVKELRQVPQIVVEELEGQRSLTSTLVNTVLLSCFCFFVIYLINKYRQGRQHQVRLTQYSALQLSEDEGGIDLQSRQFDNVKFQAVLGEDEDE
jgi:hypothetical protein